MLFNKKRIYLDYASATPILPIGASTVAAVSKMFGNPGGMHREAVQAKAQLGKARASIASAIGCTANRIVLTSGGTEGNNIAVLGVAQHIIRTSGDLSKTHWIASAIEHDSILNVFSEVERLGGKVSYVEPNQNGIIEPSALALTLRPETVFVSIGWANSEIGVVQPISRLAKVIREHETISKTRVYLHADAGQAPVYEKTTVHSLGVDILTLDSGKLYGPRGIGALYVKPDVFMSSIIFGGKQELGLRPGTENVALAAGFAASFAQVVQEREAETKRLRMLRDESYSTISKQIPTLVLNGSLESLLPNMLNVSIPGTSTEYFVLALDSAGIAVSTKSACREGEEAQSHVVLALGPIQNATQLVSAEDRSEHTVRLSLGRDTTARDCLQAAAIFVKTYAHISTML